MIIVALVLLVAVLSFAVGFMAGHVWPRQTDLVPLLDARLATMSDPLDKEYRLLFRLREHLTRPPL